MSQAAFQNPVQPYFLRVSFLDEQCQHIVLMYVQSQAEEHSQVHPITNVTQKQMNLHDR